MQIATVERQVGSHILKIETGRLAKQAAGSVLVTHGDTVVLVACVTAAPREGIDFFPLTVDYREKIYAAGKFPGGFFKREGRPTLKEILTMRLIDRPLRPLFPDGYRDELLIQAAVLSSDGQNDPDILAMIGASAALAVAPIPFEGPTGAVRIGRVDGKFVVNPPQEQLEQSDIEVVAAGHAEAINMIEIGCREVSEEVVADALELAQREIRGVCEMISELKAKAGRPHKWTPPPSTSDLMAQMRQRVVGPLRDCKRIHGKQERNDAVKALRKQVITEYCPPDVAKPEFEKNVIADCLDKIEGEVLTEMILNEGRRSDGRGLKDIRPIIIEVGVLPRVHGSSIFTRGETQALVAATLGTSRDEQRIDGLMEEYSKKFMLHYNFPPFCTGEVKRVGAVSRREIGHGALAEKSLEAVLPSPDKFPYTVRLVSDILESNGSSSMASVCGGTMALMDAGVPIAQPVAGISIGSVHDNNRRSLLVDILGEEDHHGDMDFKVAGTQRGITGVQVDLKERSISMQTIRDALVLAKEARIKILREMLAALPRPRANISDYAPRILTMRINPEKIGKVIGPGGKGIKGIEATTGATVEIEDDGTIQISCIQMQGAEQARDMIEAITEEVKVGKVYSGKVTSIKDFGAFIEVTPGQDGLCHISELSDQYVKSVQDVCQIGDVLRVKVISIDEQGRVKLSRKAAIKEETSSA